MNNTALLLAGIPAVQKNLYHRIQFMVGDPVGWIQFPEQSKANGTLLICRDIEMDRAKKLSTAQKVACPADFTPDSGLSGDRETATAQAIAECLCRQNVTSVTSDRSLSLIYINALKERGINIEYNADMGVLERRAKSPGELDALQKAQEDTESVMIKACQLVSKGQARADGTLELEGIPLTSEVIRTRIDRWLLDMGYDNPGSIVACGPDAADCHFFGAGPLRTETPIIIDIFPKNKTSQYNGDCTRTVVHGKVPLEIEKAYNTVVQAKLAGMQATKAGVTGESVHRATIGVIHAQGYETGLPKESSPTSRCAMVHGTGHGVGLEVHEPPLLDFKGPELMVGDVLTIEPGLYSQAWGGVRSEDMVAVEADGCKNFNKLPDTLSW